MTASTAGSIPPVGIPAGAYCSLAVSNGELDWKAADSIEPPDPKSTDGSGD